MLTNNGGKPNVRDVLNYAMPTGPKGLSNNSVGLGGSNFGTGQQPSGPSSSGSPELGGDNCGVCGSQGKY